MADQTGIEWADSTFNPWMGCTKVSPACDHCYAERDTARFGRVEWGAGKPRIRTSEANWRKPLQWNRAMFLECVACGWRGEDGALAEPRRVCPACSGNTFEAARRRVFCASLADVFDNEVEPQWRADLLHLIFKTPNLDWLILTKRIGNASAMLEQAVADVSLGNHSWEHQSSRGFRHVAIGATICNQIEADRDIPKLLATEAAVRFVSIEPMLGPIDLGSVPPPAGTRPVNGATLDDLRGCLPRWQSSPMRAKLRSGVDWVICGGESGPKARPMHPAWVRSLRDQCASAGVPFLFKQWGEWAPRAGALHGSGTDFQFLDPECTTWPQVVRLGEHGKSTQDLEAVTPLMGEETYMQRVGKKLAGRQIDGKTHTQFPGGV